MITDDPDRPNMRIANWPSVCGSVKIEKVYCGDAARDRRMPDTPIVKARLCAEIDPDDGQLHVEVSGATCKAFWPSVGMLDGTCSKSGGMAMRLNVGRDGDATAGPMATPMGGFTAIRVAGGTRK